VLPEDMTPSQLPEQPMLSSLPAITRDILDALPVVFWEVDLATGRYTFVSRAIEELCGYARWEWLRDERFWAACIHPADRARTMATCAAARQVGHGYDQTYRLIAADGRIVWVHERATVVRAAGEGQYVLRGDLRDISAERTLADECEALAQRLTEREKELAALHRIAGVLEDEGLERNAVLAKVVQTLPAALQFPEWAMARIVLPDCTIASPDFTPTPWRIAAPITTNPATGGSLELHYHSSSGTSDDVVFLDEERQLVESVAELIGGFLRRMEARGKLEFNEHRFRALVQHATDGVTILSADGTILHQSESVEQVLGYTPEELLGTNVFAHVHPDDVSRVMEAFASALATPRQRVRVEYRYLHRDGSWHWMESIGANVLDDPAVGGIVVTSRDITAQHTAEAAIRESEARFRGAFDHAAIGMAVVGEGRRLLTVNRALCALLGYEAHDLEGMTGAEISHPDDVELIEAHLERARAGLEDSFQLEQRYVHKSGATIWCQISSAAVRDETGQLRYWISQFQDITARKELEVQLSYQALHDGLTGLPNRSLMLDRLSQTIATARRNGNQLGVLLLDLDNFKLINDSLGHATGDEVLVRVAQRLQETVREGDTVARFGGDEFVIILGQVNDASNALEVAERILAVFSSPLEVAGRDLMMTPSIGIVVSRADEYDRHDLLRHADHAMYRAKAQGRAGYNLFDAAMHDAALQRLELEHDLRQAVDRQEFQLVYQPIVALQTGTVLGLEALTRWRHPRRGLVSPAEFIPIAEDTGIITQLGAWVVHEACRQLAAWLAVPGISNVPHVSVNLSARQFRQPDLVETIRSALAASGLPARALVLELTESDVMADAGDAIARLQELRAIGVRLAIDDFGTGYSSLAQLHSLPVELLKIDRSFVSQLGTATDSTPIVSATVLLARALDLTIVAEGVETPEQLAQLRGFGCEVAQGYLFSQPLPANAVPPILRRRLTSNDGTAVVNT
jgi:diguanylate cyclase (GGDEF)-like protein/PAS domain S-box-containing protein